jgi:hypothetical protein
MKLSNFPKRIDVVGITPVGREKSPCQQRHKKNDVVVVYDDSCFKLNSHTFLKGYNVSE